MIFRFPTKQQFWTWIHSFKFQQFGPKEQEQRLDCIEEDLSTVRLLVADLIDLTGGPGWTESTSAAIIDLAKQVNDLHQIVQYQQKIIEGLKKTEDLFRVCNWNKPN